MTTNPTTVSTNNPHPVGVQAMSDANGSIRVLAIDHRDSMRRFLNPANPAAVEPTRITELKVDVVRVLINEASGVMLEPEFSIPQIIDTGLIPNHVGVIAALEAQGYLDDPATSVTSMLPGWSPELALRSGACMAKLLLPYRPNSLFADQQEAVAWNILRQCETAGIPLVLEPMLWGSTDSNEQAELIVESVRRFAAMSPGVLKVPFPGDAAHGSASRIACAQITSLCSKQGTPWALLSGGGTFERFEDQLAIAISEGCSGFMVGRALWGEAALADPADRHGILIDLVLPRLHRLNQIVAAR